MIEQLIFLQVLRKVENVVYYVIYARIRRILRVRDSLDASGSDGQLAKWYVPPAK